MDSSYLTNPLVFLIEIAFGIYILIVMLRFLLQLTKADFYNPLSHFIVKATTPVLRPLRRYIPGLGGIDVSSLVLAWILKAIELALIYVISGLGLFVLQPLVLAIPELVSLMINIYIFSILILVILSWINPGTHHPAASLLSQLTSPLMDPIRRRMPDMGGLDLSPMVAMIGLMLLKMLIVPPLNLMAKQIAM